MPHFLNSPPKNRNSERGFTLVELLTVMLVLVALASITVEMSSDLVFQQRYEITKDRYEKIKKAIIGNPQQVINGMPNIEGFVKDVGRLPFALRELTDGYCEDDTTYRVDEAACTAATKTWNPRTYLSSSDGLKDGWGNNWIYNVIGDTVKLYSQGKDKLDNGSSYDADYPGTNHMAISADNWKVNLNQIQVAINTLYDGSCSSQTCSNPIYTTFAACTGNGGTWAKPTAKANCEAGGQTWSYTPSTACIKMIRNTESSSSYHSADISINKDGYGQTIYFPNTTVTMGSFIGFLLQGGCAGDITTNEYISVSPLPNSVCVNKNDKASFTKTHCKTHNGIWIDDGAEQYCDGVVGNVCTDSTGTHLDGIAYPKFQINLVPNTTLPTINW